MKLFTRLVPAVLALCTTALAQISSDCNPMNATCSPNQGLGISNYSINFAEYETSSRVWNWTAGKATYDGNGAAFTVNKRGDTPTVKTRFYIFFGQVEVIMKAAPGQGIVSSIVVLSDTLDEIDWELIGGNNTHVQTNYFGKGNTTSYDRAVWHPISNPQEEYHNYTLDWSKEKLDFYIDSQIVRTLKYEDANGGLNYPQTPSDVRLGIWAGGDSKNDKYTIEWAGGETDYSKGPFNMYVQSLRISDASTGTQYTYGDRSGSMGSIQVANDTSKALSLDAGNGDTAAQSIKQKWNGLSTGAKIGIAASVLGVAAIGLIVFIFCCIKQRRAGKHEKLLEDAKFEKDRTELLAFRAEMGRQRSEKIALMQQAPIGVGNHGYHVPSSIGSHGGRGYQRY
ncbi:hypothetical protein H2198_001492 [Neophaeococcomyces mojaviensis]|uniref:Uncharacterized protein n=1 Tax=Neophaeococcomyces mojaviensis TaxID=3383035 RepID=A0ACC3AH15_9EURO|nr:hypothetical protein H2198_001492 [Knufia sp. JES_112]